MCQSRLAGVSDVPKPIGWFYWCTQKAVWLVLLKFKYPSRLTGFIDVPKPIDWFYWCAQADWLVLLMCPSRLAGFIDVPQPIDWFYWCVQADWLVLLMCPSQLAGLNWQICVIWGDCPLKSFNDLSTEDEEINKQCSTVTRFCIMIKAGRR